MLRLNSLRNIGVVAIATLILVGIVYGAYQSLPHWYEPTDLKKWIWGVSFILGQSLCLPVLVVMCVPFFQACRFFPETFDATHGLTLVPLIPISLVLGFGSYHWIHKPLDSYVHLAGWNISLMMGFGLLFLLSICVVAIKFSKKSVSDQKFAFYIIAMEVIFGVVVMAVTVVLA